MVNVKKNFTLLKDRKALSLPLLFGPGFFFLALGLAAVFAPDILIAVISGFFLFLGILFCLLAWKFIQFKKNMSRALKEFQSRVSIQAVNIHDPMEEADVFEEFDFKKNVLH